MVGDREEESGEMPEMWAENKRKEASEEGEAVLLLLWKIQRALVIFR